VIIVGPATAPTAAGQAEWIAAIEPWRSLGYSREGLARFLKRSARAPGGVLVARTQARGAVLGIACVQEGVLLGNFVALLAVKPEAAGRGIGRALMDAVAEVTFASRRWLYVSVADRNRAARAFYRKLGFDRVGRLPDLVRPGDIELLLRKGAPPPTVPTRRRARRRT
jgi:ribosomal protein S18 acetylase RimI-like enzyme